MITISRTVYPVGQGGFSSEIHRNEKGEITFVMVYDCGTTNNKKNNRDNKLLNDFFEAIKTPDGEYKSIDALFISHFHHDHVSMLGELKQHVKIDNVFIPLLKQTTKNLILSFATIIVKNLLTQPEKFFEDSRIITIEQFDDPKESENQKKDDSVVDLIDNERRYSKKGKGCIESYPSGTIFKSFDYWIYKPYNIFHELSDKLKQCLTQKGIRIEELENNIAYIEANKSAIKKAYEGLDKDINKNSLLLFSVPSTDQHMDNKYDYTFDICYYNDQDCKRNCILKFLLYAKFNYSKCFPKKEVGCLFTGDCDLNKIGNLSSNVNDCIKNKVGTMQIPHHGARGSWKFGIIPSPCFIGNIHSCFVQYGKNLYGHPSYMVLDDITSFCKHRKEMIPFVYHVTHEPSTRLTQIITLKNILLKP